MKSIITFILAALLLSSCVTTVNPNEWVVSTATCWNEFTVTKAGQIVPRMVSACDRMIILPATELGADFNVETKFKDRVAGKVNITYQWRISDPIEFVKSAKSITTAQTGSDHRVAVEELETIENTIVDKLLINLVREYTPDKPAGTSEKDIEDDLNKLATSAFSDRGVVIFNISINVEFSPQTEEALDVLSALKFYEQNGELELGREIIKAKAGATRVTVTQ